MALYVCSGVSLGNKKHMHKFITACHFCPQARVKENGCLSSATGQNKGVSYYLCFDPGTSTLLMGKLKYQVMGIPGGGKEFTIVGFADNVPFFLMEPTKNYQILFKTWNFKQLSNLKIHYSKSSELNVSLHMEDICYCHDHFQLL